MFSVVLADISHDHVLDELRVEVVSLDKSLEGYGGEIDGMSVLEGPVATTDRCADRIDDYCVSHVTPF